MKKNNYFVAAFLLLLSTVGAYAGNTRVIGYFPSYRATTDVSAQCSKLTDIIFSFINSNTDGTLITGNASDATFGFDMNKYIIVRDAASLKGTNLWLAVGGADQPGLRAARLATVCGNSGYRDTYAAALIAFATAPTTSCYGISIDWEFPTDAGAKAAHLAFMQLLRTKIAASSNPNLKLAMAVGGETTGQINHTQYLDASFFSSNANLVDEWHIMAYDFPTNYDGTYHSSLANATTSLEGWNGKGVPYNKMVLGVPFYGRGTNNRNLEIKYNDWTPSSIIYNADLNAGYSYNGIVTLKAKVDLAVNKAAMGILIWDLGQDLAPSHQYSLLNGIDAYVYTLCNIPKPNLGPDKGFCAPNAVTLDPGVASAGGRTFSWYKDNAIINGQSGLTYSASAAGTYKVVIDQGAGCSRSDEIAVVAGSPFITVGANGCVGDNLSLTVSNPTNGKTYDWYDQAVSGTKKGSGTSYSQVFNSNTTLYVEEKAAGVSTYTSSTALVQANYAWNGKPGAGVYARADFMTVVKDLTIKSVRVFANGPAGATFTIKVLKAIDNTLVSESSSNVIAADGTKQSWEYTLKDVNIGITLTPGEYFITANVTAGSLAMKFDPAASTVTTETGVYSLGIHCHTNFGSGFLKSETSDVNSYKNAGQLYNYVIETGANASCGRTPATATVITCGPPTVTITAPTSNQDFPFVLNSTVTLTATVVDETSVSSVSFEIWDGLTKLETISPIQSGSVYSAVWTMTTYYTSKQYTLKVVAKDNLLNTTTQPQNFTVTSGVGAVEVLSFNDVKLYPNPASDNVNIAIDVTNGGAASLAVYDLAGRAIYSENSMLNAGKNTSTISAQNFAAGTYLLKVTLDGQSLNKSFSIVK